MAVPHDKRGDKDRKSHIGEIKQRLAEMSGGRIVVGGTEALPVEEQEKFWCRVKPPCTILLNRCFDQDVNFTTNVSPRIDRKTSSARARIRF